MRSTFVGLLLAILLTWPSLAQTEPVVLRVLPGEWFQIASNAGKCPDCRIRIERAGQDLTVTSSNGWSAIVRQSFQGKPFVAGKGGWRQNVRGVYGGREFYLNLGMKGDELLMLMTVPSPDGNLHNIKAIFRRQATSGGA
jgi:hypothetical protein